MLAIMRALALTLLILLVLAAAPAAASASSARYSTTATGEVTVTWPDRLCADTSTAESEWNVSTQQQPGEDGPAEPSESDQPELEDPGTEDDPDAGDWPTVTLAPWKIVYHSDGTHDEWYDVSCASDGQLIEFGEPGPRALAHAARLSQRAKARTTARRARRRGLHR
jgi:hypothetical protein